MDTMYMAKALELAKKGIGSVNPNPLVGALIVKNKRVIGEGYHQYYGGPHGEVNAFLNAKEDVKGATMYVTLEPCSHFGKTPPCAHAIVKNKIKRVVIAMEDPNPLVAGNGINILRENGIEVNVGILRDEAKKLNEVFIKYITKSLPFCTLKTAMTLDGKIATYTGDSKWITNEDSREYVHHLRNQYTSIMVGIGTLLMDDPLLTTRLEEGGRNPIRIILDSQGRIPLDSKIMKTARDIQTIIGVTEKAPRENLKLIEDMGAQILITPMKDHYIDLSYLMKKLGEQKIDSVLLEGGSTLNYSALHEGIIDKVIAFIAPKIVGGLGKTPVGGGGRAYMKDAIILKNLEMRKFKDDYMIEGYLRKEV